MKPASTQRDMNMEFDGIGQGPAKASNKFAGNQSGLTGTVNAGRGPVRGNDGTCHDPISGAGSAKGAPVSATGKEQKRGPGGVVAKCPANPDRQNVGRGPTKGNQQ